MKRRLGVEIKVRGARKVWAKDREYGVVAEMEKVEDKLEVLVRKRELGKGVYVDEDLEKEGRETQKILRWVAYVERKKGKRVEVGCGVI